METIKTLERLALYAIIAVSLMSMIAWLAFYTPLLYAQTWQGADFLGAIVGGAVGGLFTVVAGWLAWSATRKAIEQQQKIIDRLNEEDRQRKIQILWYIAHSLLENQAELQRVTLTVTPPDNFVFPRLGTIAEALASEDLWRLDYDLTVNLRLVNTQLKALNSEHESKVWSPDRSGNFRDIRGEYFKVEDGLFRVRTDVTKAIESLDASLKERAYQRFGRAASSG